MKEKIVTLYICDHCKKKLFRKHAMIRHEKFCFHNPDNKQKCLHECAYLIRSEIEYEGGCDYDGAPRSSFAKGYQCAKLNKYLYSLRAKERGLLERYPETFDGQEAMPKECEHYEITY